MDSLENQSNEERDDLSNSESLWKDSSLITISLRRHSKYDLERESVSRGALTTEGIQMAQSAFKDWKKYTTVNTETDIQLVQSPSYMVNILETEKFGQEIIRQRRATTTASILERELYNNQANRRHDERRLGDFMEYATSAELIAVFFKKRSEKYGENIAQFWHDYITGTLDGEVQTALEDCGGSSAKQLALHVTDFIQMKTTVDPTEFKKKIVFGVTHGETMTAFLHQIANYLRSRSKDLAEKLDYHMFDYNEGFDVHVDRQGSMKIVVGQSTFSINLQDFHQYLQKAT